MMEAIVLAGGFGTRLRSMVAYVPKPMASVSGKPFLEILLHMLKSKGFKRVIVSAGYMADKIIDYFGKEFIDIELVYEIETDPLGTGGAIKKAMSHVKSDHVYIFNGDTYFDIDITALETLWKKTKNSILVARQVQDTTRYGRLSVKNGYLSEFEEKSDDSCPGFINGGVYVLRPDIFDGYSYQNKFSFEQEFLPALIQKTKINVLTSKGLFIDIGVPEDYILAQNILQVASDF